MPDNDILRQLLTQQQPKKRSFMSRVGGGLQGLGAGLLGQTIKQPAPAKTSLTDTLVKINALNTSQRTKEFEFQEKKEEASRRNDLNNKYIGLDPTQYEKRGEYTLMPTYKNGVIVGEEWEKSKRAEAEAKASGKEREALAGKKGPDLAVKFGEAGRLVGMFKNLQGQFKRVDEDFKLGGRGAGAFLTDKVAGLPVAPAWLQKASVPLEGAKAQRQETKIAAMPIISGQARFVVSLANMMDDIIPDIDREPENADELMTQSIRNAMTLVYGVTNGYFTAENMLRRGQDPKQDIQSQEEALAILNDIQISPGQESAIQEAIAEVMNTPALRDVEKTKSRGLPEAPGSTQGKTSSGNPYTMRRK